MMWIGPAGGTSATMASAQVDMAVGSWSEEADAVEADPFMAGSPAEAQYYWENGGEWPDGTHALDYCDDEEQGRDQEWPAKPDPADFHGAATNGLLDHEYVTAPHQMCRRRFGAWVQNNVGEGSE